MIGPGQSAQQTYEPSGVTIKGNYYLAPVTLYDRSGRQLGETVPMEVLVTTQACDKSGAWGIDKSTAYMGVGFGRPAPDPSEEPGLMNGPEENAFLQLAPIVQGTMHPGFGLTPAMLTIGRNRTTEKKFPSVALTPFPDRPGDWRGPPACVRFNGGSYQCGRMLVDIGINTMFVTAVRPSTINHIEIAAPSPKRPLLHYAFDYPVRPDATPPAPNGSGSEPVAFAHTPPPVFINTGRDVLAAVSYSYDAGCGRVGLRRHR